VIAASLVALAVWLGFSKPLPNKIKVKKSLSAKQLSYFLAAVVIIFLPTITGVIISLLTLLFLPKIISTLPAKSTQQQHRAIQQELDLVIDLLAAALGAGLGVLAALDAVSNVVQPKLATELTAAANRIQWGADVEAAFNTEFRVIGAALARAMDHGVGAGKALAEIAHRTRLQRKAELLRRTKKLSVTLALPVALLMLPGFILVGVVPMIVPALSSLW
jgi:pilus assembly protein TadC